jgi:hypothetical protein
MRTVSVDPAENSTARDMCAEQIGVDLARAPHVELLAVTECAVQWSEIVSCILS